MPWAARKNGTATTNDNPDKRNMGELLERPAG
jgi:hypothetical protein